MRPAPSTPARMRLARGEPHGDYQAVTAGARTQFDRSAMALRNALDDRQPQAAAVDAAGIGAIKAVEYPLTLRRRDARTTICNDPRRPARTHFCGHVDTTAGLRITHGVVDQIAD